MCKKSHYYTYLCDCNHIFIILARTFKNRDLLLQTGSQFFTPPELQLTKKIFANVNLFCMLALEILLPGEKRDIILKEIRGKTSRRRADKMKLSYKKLWVKLVEMDMKKTEFAKKVGISSASIAKLGKGANITTDVLVKICEYLKCDIADIMEIVPDESSEEGN